MKFTSSHQEKTRPANAGNTLWRLYCSLSEAKQRELKNKMKMQGIAISNLYQSDTLKEKDVALISPKRRQLYEEFFNVSFIYGGISLNEVKRMLATRADTAEGAREQLKQTA